MNFSTTETFLGNEPGSLSGVISAGERRLRRPLDLQEPVLSLREPHLPRVQSQEFIGMVHPERAEDVSVVSPRDLCVQTKFQDALERVVRDLSIKCLFVKSPEDYCRLERVSVPRAGHRHPEKVRRPPASRKRPTESPVDKRTAERWSSEGSSNESRSVLPFCRVALWVVIAFMRVLDEINITHFTSLTYYLLRFILQCVRLTR